MTGSGDLLSDQTPTVVVPRELAHGNQSFTARTELSHKACAPASELVGGGCAPRVSVVEWLFLEPTLPMDADVPIELFENACSSFAFQAREMVTQILPNRLMHLRVLRVAEITTRSVVQLRSRQR